VQAFDVLADPVRRRILELLAAGEVAAGDLVAVVTPEFGLSQPAVSQHLKVLRENGFAVVRAEGARRLYSLDPAPLRLVGDWVGGLLTSARPAWQSLDALATEISRGRRSRRPQSSVPASDSSTETTEEKIS
jgi:DNA-binding transcriptional ArsR family regulator